MHVARVHGVSLNTGSIAHVRRSDTRSNHERGLVMESRVMNSDLVRNRPICVRHTRIIHIVLRSNLKAIVMRGLLPMGFLAPARRARTRHVALITSRVVG